MPNTELRKYKIYINNVEVNYRDGAVLDYAFNETLDSGILIIPNVTSKLQIKRQDVVKIEKLNQGTVTDTKYLAVAGFNWELASNNQPFIYTYNISVVSLTIKLQSDLLPNITITQPLTDKRSIYYEIQRLNKILGSKYTFSSFLISKTNNVICPEFQWNKRNFWEILNDLLSVVDCVVTMENPTKISCIELNGSNGNDVIDYPILDIKYFEDANEYCTELEMNSENVVGDNVSSISQDWITPRSTSYIIDTKNAQVILEKPIYFIKKVMIRFKTVGGIDIEWVSRTDPTQTGTDAIGSGYTFTFDITKWVVEQEVYNTKLPTNLFTYTDAAFNYKRFFLSYKEGSETIDNLGYDEKEWIPLITSDPAIWNIITWEIWHKYIDDHPNKQPIGENHLNAYPDMREILFTVEYTALNTIRFRTAKQNSSNLNPKVLPSNQGASYVDAKALGLSEQANANRIGNPYYQIVIRNYVPSVNDYYMDETGSKYYLSQYSYTLSNIGTSLFKGIFVKDFIRKNLFTGINSKARWTSIATGSEALLRQDIVNLKFNASVTQQSEYQMLGIITYMWAHLGQIKPLVSLTKTDVISDYFYLPISSYLLGNNHIILEFRFKDNVSAGMQVDSTNTNNYICKGCNYVDSNGEFSDIAFDLMSLDSYDSDYATRGKKYPIAYKNGAKINAFPNNNDVIELTDVLKDNREIYGICVDIEIVPDQKIKIYDLFYKLLPMVNQEVTDIYVYISTTGQEIAQTEIVYLDQDINRYITVEGQYVNFYIEDFCTDRNVNINDVVSWGFCTDSDEKIIESIDSTTTSGSRRMYFNKL